MAANNEEAETRSTTGIAEQPAVTEGAPGESEPVQEDLDGWSYVKRGKGRKTIIRIQEGSHEAQARRPPPQSYAVDEKVVAELVAKHKAFASEWMNSKCCAAIRVLIRDHCSGRPPIKKAVCLGVGSLQFQVHEGFWLRSILAQVEAFRVIVEELSNIAGQPIPCQYQEPWFTSNDELWIRELAKADDAPSEIVNNAFEWVDESTFVFGVHLYAKVWHSLFEHRRPAMIIGNDFDFWTSSPHISPKSKSEQPDDFWACIAEATAGRVKIPFPQDDGYPATAFSDTFLWLDPLTKPA